MGLKASYDANRLIHMARVIDDEICYPAKHACRRLSRTRVFARRLPFLAVNIYQLFHTRYSLHKTGKDCHFGVHDVSDSSAQSTSTKCRSRSST